MTNPGLSVKEGPWVWHACNASTPLASASARPIASMQIDDQTKRYRTLADRRRHPFDGSTSHVARAEHAWATRFEDKP